MFDLVQKIEEKELTSFFLNPFERTACIGNRLLQKYPRGPMMDDIIAFKVGTRDCDIYGCVDYVNKYIAVGKSYLLNYDVTKYKPFLSLYDFRYEAFDIIRKKLDKMKITKLPELKNSIDCKMLYEQLKAKIFEPLIFSLLGTQYYNSKVKPYGTIAISMFIDMFTLDDMIAIKSGDTCFVDKELERIFNTENFMTSEIIMPLLKEEAQKSIENGTLSKRQLHLKNYLEKTKNCGALRFTVETKSGETLSCQNTVNFDGSLSVVNRMMKKIDFEDVVKVTYKNKVIYKKGVF